MGESGMEKITLQGQRRRRVATEGRGDGPEGGSQEGDKSVDLSPSGVLDYPVMASLNPAQRLLLFVSSFEILCSHIGFPYCEQRGCCRTFIEKGQYFMRQELHWSLYGNLFQIIISLVERTSCTAAS